ncbi:hypothetical protein ACFLZ6_00115 [Nanoarchaeota archaeon]
MVSLEDKYNWSELCDITVGKIEHKLKQKEVPSFKKWFMQREGIGYRFDYQLVLRAYRIWQELQNNLDHFAVISGREGFGKSTLALQLASWVNPNFQLTNVCYGAKSFLDILGNRADEFIKVYDDK